MDNPTTNITTSGTVICTPKNPASGLNTAQGFMSACEAGTLQITMGMFFDGTGNNKFNSDNSRNTTDDSYGNSYSNVARAWQFYKGSLNGVTLNNPQNRTDAEGVNFNFYVEGIGTKKDKEDSNIGFGLGMGLYGISQRVKEASRSVADTLRKQKDIDTITTIEITFDVFGFSRGAAAGRHFVDRNSTAFSYIRGRFVKPSNVPSIPVYKNYVEFYLNNQQDKFITIEINWNFLGLYETVSSHGPNRSDDVGELGLDNLTEVKAGLQIVAEDEYREKFSLTTVKSNKNITVIKLPGVHSDIGGGYSGNNIGGTQEKNYVLYFIRFGNFFYESKTIVNQHITNIKNWFLNNGWYKNTDTLEINTIGDQTGRIELIGTRKNIKNTYSHIPLHIMTKQAIANGVNFDTALLSTYSIESGLLSKIYNSSSTGVNLNVLDPDELKEFRRYYLHWSSRLYTLLGGHDPRIVDSEPNYPKYKRETIDG